MKYKNIILVSAVFAVAILISNYVLRGTPYNEPVRNGLIALWFIPFAWLLARDGKK